MGEEVREIMTTGDAAAYLRCSEVFLNTDRVTQRRGIPFFRLGRRIRYRKSDLDAYMDKRIVNPVANAGGRER